MSSDDTEVSRILINLGGEFSLGDGRVGTVVSSPELSELNSFLGVLKESLEPTNGFETLFAKLGKKFRKQKGSILEIRTTSDGKELTHSFSLSNQENLTYEETDELLTKAGWSLDCWHPLEISCAEGTGSVATGHAAKLLIKHLQQTL
jgi:hypothetical protein